MRRRDVDDRTMIVRAVLTFHSIDEDRGPLSFDARRFEALLVALKDCAIPVVDLDTLLKAGTRQGVAITFDDGLRSVFTDALPALRRHGAPAHVFLCPALLDGHASGVRGSGGALLSWDMAVRLQDHGLTIESHTLDHRDVRTMSDAEIDADCAAADSLIEQRTGRKPRYFAYPFGRFDARVAQRIGSRYEAAFTTRLAFLSDPLDRARLPRLDAHYLRASLLQRNLGSTATRLYLGIRGLLRELRGTQ